MDVNIIIGRKVNTGKGGVLECTKFWMIKDSYKSKLIIRKRTNSNDRNMHNLAYNSINRITSYF